MVPVKNVSLFGCGVTSVNERHAALFWTVPIGTIRPEVILFYRSENRFCLLKTLRSHLKRISSRTAIQSFHPSEAQSLWTDGPCSPTTNQPLSCGGTFNGSIIVLH